MTRLILAFAALAVLSGPGVRTALSQDWDYSAREAAREARREAREAAQDARQEARERAREARERIREARQESWDQWRNNGRDGVHLRLLKSYRLAAGEVATEPVVVIGGTADIDGRLDDDLVVVGGTLRLGANAVVLGDVAVVGGQFERHPSARIDGTVDTTIVDWPNVDFGWGTVPEGWWRVASLGAMITRLGLVLFVSLMLTWLTPGWVNGIGARASGSAGTALFMGVTTQVLFVPALIVVCVMLVISIVGIPLLLAVPFVMAFLALAWTAGFAGVVGRIGARLRGQTGGVTTSPTLDLLTGFAAVTALTVIANFVSLGPWWTAPMWWTFKLTGFAVEWIVWTMGLGAAMTSILGRRSDAPPAIPIMPQSAPSAL